MPDFNRALDQAQILQATMLLANADKPMPHSVMTL
jgi:hypothetical protein